MQKNALVIDDDLATLEFMEFQLNDEGFSVKTANCGVKGLALMEEFDFDIILTDLNLPDINGIEMVARCKKLSPETEIIMITAYGSTEKAVDATKAGAFYFVEKPVEFEELLVLIEKAIDRKSQNAEIRELRGKLSNRTSYEGIIGGSQLMQDIYEIIDSVAESDANILIVGESGTGKEVIANAIHYKSLRSKKPFVKLNCSALPKELIESELFGHKKGSFTGAINDKVGYLGRADGGSILLDEIGEMPLSLQPKLLRVLQERIFYQVGSDRPQTADFRLISSTNRKPLEAIRDGNLREDLYYRLNTIEINIPPLRSRMDDVPMLANHFLGIYAEKYDRRGIAFSKNASSQLLNYSWRGNVRELQHVVERAVLLGKAGKIESLNIPRNEVSAMAAGSSLPINTSHSNQVKFSDSDMELPEKDFFQEVGEMIVENLPALEDIESQNDVFNQLERHIVMAALRKTEGNKQAAARLLGLYRPRLYGMLKRHNISDENLEER